MTCGHCRGFSTDRVEVLEVHWRVTGCPWGRPVWVRYVKSRRAGRSGRRILHDAWPDAWKSDPMDDEARERLRVADARREAAGVKRRPGDGTRREKRRPALSAR